MSISQPCITPDSFFYTSSNRTQSDQALSPVTVFMISGNPGLITYYHPFLSLLSEKLKSSGENHTFQIYGHSLGGFEVEKQSDQSHDYDLEGQICFVQKKLDEFLGGQGDDSNINKTGRPKVILMGHSVGAYIAMETVRRHRERPGGFNYSVDFDIIGGVLLFPTVVDIAKSPSGVKLTRLLCLIPQLALVVSFLAKILTLLLPDMILRSVVKSFMGSPPDSAVNTTATFLKSNRGVRQALHMAADEMKVITADKWSDDVWGMSTVKEPLTRLFFYFGRNDHWVAERTREEIIELRGRTESGPTMLVCEGGLPHAFCLRHNDLMARKVADMVKEIVGG